MEINSYPISVKLRANSTASSLSLLPIVNRIRPCIGIFIPAATNALYKAFSNVLSFPIASPVDFISGPKEISTLRNFENENTGAFT